MEVGSIRNWVIRHDIILVMNTSDIKELIGVVGEERDLVWRKNFYACIVNVPLSVHEEFLGPDNFPYIKVVLVSNNPTERVFVKDLLDSCLTEGRGIACYGEDQELVWVFSYGALRSLKEGGSFEIFDTNLTNNSDRVEIIPVSDMMSTFERRTVEAEREIFTGQPSETFFPLYARNVVRKYLETIGVMKISIIQLWDSSLTPPQSILFSVFREDFPDEREFLIFMERLSWFFPPYGVMSMSKDSTKDFQFEPL